MGKLADLGEAEQLQEIECRCNALHGNFGRTYRNFKFRFGKSQRKVNLRHGPKNVWKAKPQSYFERTSVAGQY